MAMANMNLIGVFVTKLWPVQSLACGGGGDGGATKDIIPQQISNFGDIIITTLFCKQIQVPTAIYILHLKRNIPYFKPHNLISYILHPQITSPTFYTPISHLPHCFPISHLPHFFTPNLPPPTFFYPQSPTSHFLCHPSMQGSCNIIMLDLWETRRDKRQMVVITWNSLTTTHLRWYDICNICNILPVPCMWFLVNKRTWISHIMNSMMFCLTIFELKIPRKFLQ